MGRGPEQLIEEFAWRLIASGAAAPNQLLGCSDGEIERVRLDQEVERLPPIYAAFLRRMGREAGLLLRGTDAFYPAVLGIKRAAREILEEGQYARAFPDDSLVLDLHQGYMFCFFPSVMAENPEVLTYIEGDLEWHPTMRWPNYLSYLESALKGAALTAQRRATGEVMEQE